MSTPAEWIREAGERADAAAVADLSRRAGAILLAEDVLAADAFLALAGIVIRASQDIGGPDAGAVLTALTLIAKQGLDRGAAVEDLLSRVAPAGRVI